MSSTEPQTISAGDTAWILMSTALVMLMIPGLGYFYSGLASHKNALSLIFLSMISLAVVSVQWFILGYSLAFGETGSPVIGNLKHAFLSGIVEPVSTNGDNSSQQVVYTYPGVQGIPGICFVAYQGMFAAITPSLALGAAAERTRIGPLIVFLFVWSTLVYDFIAYWTWAKNGWLRTLGSLDFAGGSPVHIASGAAGLAYSLVAGKRSQNADGGNEEEPYKPHNLSSVFLGTALLWFGWFGFNGGSALLADQFAAVAIVNTNLSASMGAITWVLLDYVGGRKKFSAFAFCCGAIAGLVCVTPAAGFIAPWSAFLFGLVGAVTCHTFLRFKHVYGFDDSLDVFGVHGVGGVAGNLLTGIFASNRVNRSIAGGWVSGNWMQFLYQLTGTAVSFGWSFVMTYGILYCMDRLPYLNLRLTREKELLGLDRSQMGETAYDYLEAATTQPIITPSVSEEHENEVKMQELTGIKREI